MSVRDCPHWGKDGVRGIRYCSRGLDGMDGHSIKVITEGMCESCDVYQELEEKYKETRNGSSTN